MDKSYETQRFKTFIKQHFTHTIFVSSTQTAKQLFAEYNLTPAEFFRPFGFFHGKEVEFFSPDKNQPVKVEHFWMNFYDDYQYKQLTRDQVHAEMKRVMHEDQPEDKPEDIEVTKLCYLNTRC